MGGTRRTKYPQGNKYEGMQLENNKQTKISDRRNSFSFEVNEALLGASSISYIRVLNNLRPFLIF